MMATKRKIPVIYILSASHSGSTLLSMLLGSHEEVCTIGELKATSFGDTERYLCSCRSPIKQCGFWKAIRQDMGEWGIDFDITNAGTDIRSGADRYVRILLGPLHRGPLLETIRDTALRFSPSWTKNLEQIQYRNTKLIECVLKRTRKKIIVDSSKIGIRLKFLLRNPSLDVRMIRLTRDGRAVTNTYMNPWLYADATEPNLRSGGTGEDRDNECLSIYGASREWLRSNEEAETILRGIDRSRWIEVSYEALCNDRETTMDRLFAFIGVDPKATSSDFRSVNHHVIGNGMRLDAGCEVRIDNRWQQTLSRADLRIFETVAGHMNRKLGYQN